MDVGRPLASMTLAYLIAIACADIIFTTPPPTPLFYSNFAHPPTCPLYQAATSGRSFPFPLRHLTSRLATAAAPFYKVAVPPLTDYTTTT